MLTSGIWCLGVLLEAVLIWRGLQENLVRQYPVFYSYLGFVFAQEFLRIAVFRWFPNDYFVVYWITQLLGFLFGSAVIFEIYQVALRAYPGAAKMARNLLFLLFGTVFGRAVLDPSTSLDSWFQHTFHGMERELRVVQTLTLLALIVLFLWYAIPFGKNLRGILLGYTAFVVVGVFQFSMLARFWSKLHEYWSHTIGCTYLLVLSCWTWSLWSEHTAPTSDSGPQLEKDYACLVGYTHRQLHKLRSHLHWTAAP